MTNVQKQNNIVRFAARKVADTLNPGDMVLDEEIVEAVERELGWVLGDHECRVALSAFKQRRKDIERLASERQLS